MTELEAIRECKEHWKNNKFLAEKGEYFPRTEAYCVLCTRMRATDSDCNACPLGKIGEVCSRLNSTWGQTATRTPESCQAMIDLLQRCEDIELKRLEDSNER